jgi:S1-C subfamily serine protease
MNKRVLLMAGAAVGAVVLVAAAIFAGSNIVNAATRGGRTLATRLGQRSALQQIQAPTNQNGVVVVIVEKDSPADKAGVTRGDVLLQIDSTVITQTADLFNYLNGKKSGDTVSLNVTHGDTTKTLNATLTDRNGKAFLGVLVYGGRGMGRGFWSMGTPISSTHALVTQVITDSPAAGAGIVAGDVIVSVDGKELAAGNTLASAISAHKAGDKVILSIQHKGATTTTDVTATLAANPDTTKTGAYLGVQYAMGGRRGGKRFGPGPGMPMPFGRGFTQQGVAGAIVFSVTVGSPADTAGLKQGDLVTAIDGTALNTPQALVTAIAAHKPGDVVTVSVQHQGAPTSTDIKITLGDNPNKKGTAYLGVSVGGRRMMSSQNGSQGMPGFNAPGLRRFFGNGQPGNGNGANQNTSPAPGNTL